MVVRKDVRESREDESDIAVVGEASDGQQAVEPAIAFSTMWSSSMWRCLS